MKHLNLIILALATTLFSGPLRAETSDTIFKSEQVPALVQPYIALQEALAADDLEASKTAVGQLRAAIPEERLKAVVSTLTTIRNAEDLSTARQPFKIVSDALIELIRQHTAEIDSDLYLAYCPMAFDNRGAFWIQDDQTLNNPYYGSMMLRCGVIRESLSGAGSQGESHHRHHSH